MRKSKTPKTCEGETMNKAEKEELYQIYKLIWEGFTGDRSSMYQEGLRLKEMNDGLTKLRDIVLD